MRVLNKVSFEEVFAVFRQYHGSHLEYEENTNEHTETSLQMVNEQLGGVWHKILLNEKDIRSVILPWHLSCGGKLELVPKEGQTVAQTVQQIEGNESSYKTANPVCCGKIQYLKTAALTPLFLTRKAVVRSFYKLLAEENKTGLVHIDGLHRMIAWIQNGRLKNGEEVEAYVAGKLKD